MKIHVCGHVHLKKERNNKLTRLVSVITTSIWEKGRQRLKVKT